MYQPLVWNGSGCNALRYFTRKINTHKVPVDESWHVNRSPLKAIYPISDPHGSDRLCRTNQDEIHMVFRINKVFFFKETAWSELHRNEVLLQKMTTIQHSLFKGSVWTRLYQWDDVDTSLYIVAYVFGILPACMNAASLVSFDTEIPLKACCFWMCYWYA